jgi:hypothetical protein
MGKTAGSSLGFFDFPARSNLSFIAHNVSRILDFRQVVDYQRKKFRQYFAMDRQCPPPMRECRMKNAEWERGADLGKSGNLESRKQKWTGEPRVKGLAATGCGEIDQDEVK